MASNPTDGPSDWPEYEHDPWRPSDVREWFQNIVEYQAEHDRDRSPFAELFTPRARTLIIDALLGASEDLTAREVCERARIDRSTFADHETFLVEVANIVERPHKKGNAWVYRLRERHPVVQLLTMADTVLRHGQTPLLLEEQFVGDPAADYEPGDYPADPR